MLTPSENKRLIVVIISVLVSLTLFWFFCVNHVGVNHVGVAFNMVNGNLTVQSNSGFYVTSPLTRAMSLSTLPMKVHVPSSAKVINTKVVKLKTENILDFVRLQGFSLQISPCLENILMGYAFSGQKFSFLEIVQEGGIENAPTTK
jgi:hypothetical protein